jgi:cobyrinic acid a,c-diamide synthase
MELPDAPAVCRPGFSRIGVARDEAFSFYYPASLRVLEEQGAAIVPFSPLRDPKLPDVDGLLFGGGFPEMFLPQLAANESMRADIRAAAAAGVPIAAECGGYMYLCRRVASFDGGEYPMAGLIPQVCRMEKKLQTVGYVEATALADNVFCAAGETLRGHEFHFSSMTADGSGEAATPAFQFRKNRTGVEYPAGFVDGNVLASYLHIHFAGNPAAARRFVNRCAEHRQRTEGSR